MTMRALLSIAVAWLALAGSARAQEWLAEYQKQFRAGIDALQAGRHAEGIAAFQRCLELHPKDGTCAYNIACGYSLAGEIEPAFEWLGHSVEWGFGNTEGNIDHAKKDADLERLRSDPRFAKSIARMEEMLEKLRRYYAEPAIHLPDSLKEAEEVPLLVVLHDARQTKEQVVTGPWKRVADELGMALVAPSGKFPTADEPAQGMAWFDDSAAYVQRSWIYERTVQDAVSAFKKEHKLDAKRVFLAGEGQGGLVAFNVGVGGPGLYKGVLVVNAPFVEQLAAAKGTNAGKMGFKARFLLEEGGDWFPKDKDLRALADSLRERLEGWGIACDVSTFRRSEQEPDREHGLILEAIRALGPEAAPVEAGTGKKD
jgi:predicted esterase